MAIYKRCYDITPWNVDMFNLVIPGRSECNFKKAIFNSVSLIDIFRYSYDNTLRCMPFGLTDDKSILVQVMAWCCQATTHYLSQTWPRSLASQSVLIYTHTPRRFQSIWYTWCCRLVTASSWGPTRGHNVDVYTKLASYVPQNGAY